MTRKGQSKYLKRMAAPKFWPILRKKAKWSYRPMPGPHSRENCIPLGVLIRDVLKLAETRREVKYILSNDNILIDGRVRKELNFPVGLMDIVEIPKIEKYYRIVPFERKGLLPLEINSSEKNFKLCKIINKTILKGNILQLNLHDGKNILIKEPDSEEDKDPLQELEFKTKDVLKISLPDQKILDHYSFEENKIVIVQSGRFLGKHGKIIEINKRFGANASTITLQDDEEKFQTLMEYGFIIGRAKPDISLPN
ncbi:MAG: 30S ribosomal protein S4e [Candidatus Lokiarchaeota archaeon]|nr:30S ribosomal protein S4e [Candidatus Lokiarchaeota archaeon]